MKSLYKLSLIFFLLVFTLSCNTEEEITSNENDTPQLIEYDYLAVATSDNEVFFQNELRNDKIQLGKVLFYDKKLSLNNTVSCATCHKQEFAFGDNTAKSIGFEDKLTNRNSPAIINLGSSRRFFWDNRVSNLEEQVVIPITNHVEMGFSDMDDLIKRINGIDYYSTMFNDIYGGNSIEKNELADALSQFVRSIQSFVSKFDERENRPLSVKEQFGLLVFNESKCNSCHMVTGQNTSTGVIIINDFTYTGGNQGDVANTGLEKNPVDKGAGEGRFKVPTLRNLAYSAPYMHDGRLRTLDEVINHYDTEIVNSNFLDIRLKNVNGDAMRLNLSIAEKEALKAFILTLSDESTITNPMYSNPFVY